MVQAEFGDALENSKDRGFAVFLVAYGCKTRQNTYNFWEIGFNNFNKLSDVKRVSPLTSSSVWRPFQFLRIISRIVIPTQKLRYGG